MPKRFAVLVLGSLLSGAAFASDTDGDGVEDDWDCCPAEDATGHDFYEDGCIDTAPDFALFIEDLRLDDEDAEAVLVALAENVALAVRRGHPFFAKVQVHSTQAVARAFFADGVITLRQMRAINDFARALVATL